MNHEVIRRYSGLSDDARVQFLEHGEARFLRQAGYGRDFKQDEVIGVLHPEIRRRVEEAVARKLMDNLKNVIRSDFLDSDQRILHPGGHLPEATLVVSSFEDMNC